MKAQRLRRPTVAWVCMTTDVIGDVRTIEPKTDIGRWQRVFLVPCDLGITMGEAIKRAGGS